MFAGNHEDLRCIFSLYISLVHEFVYQAYEYEIIYAGVVSVEG